MKYRRKIVFHAPPRILSAVVWLACFPGLSGVRANPVGEVIQSGTATFERTPDRLTVTTGDRVVIGWQDFSIGRGELTQFVQPSSSSLAVNRVMSGNPSQLFGTLQANGHVVLINPNGILVGGGAVVDTGSFLATTLDADPERLVTGQDWRFKGTSAAAIENQGTILARSGDLILISREVRNTGTLSAPSGVAALAGGREVLVSWAPDASRRIFVRPEGLDGRVHNAGAIAAAQAELVASGGNPYALAINNEGIIRATGSLKQEGRVYLVARDGTLGHSGSIYARNADGSGGSIRIEGSGVGVSGRLDTSSDLSKGGSIRIEGDHILLSHGAGLTVSGRTGGGSVEMGGGLHGDDPDIREAQNVTVENGVRIEADARQSGDGGLVVVWSNGATSFQGTISARGGVQGGNGGFVEVSGLESWFFPNWLTGVDVSAPAGKAGTFLIDPTEITITGNGTSVPIGNGTVSTATLLDQDVADYLQNVGNLVIQTTGANGDILILNGVSISWTSANDLTLSADRNLTFQSGAVISSATGDLNLNFAQSSDGTLTFADALPDVLALNISGGSGGGITTILRGPDNGAIFTISASTVNDGTQSATYSNIDQLVGGSGDDSFVFSGATTFSGDIDGGGATTGDTIDFSAATGFATTVDTGDLDPSNRAGTVIGVEVFVAPSGSQTLRGSSNASRSWNVGTNGVTTSGILYKGFENLLGRNGVDTFTFANGATFSGGIDGGSGSDVIVLTGSGQSISLTATGAGSVNGSGTFTDIQVLDGGGQGTLTGPNAATIWSITGSNSGTVLSTGFSNFGSLVGGNNVADSFVFDDAVVWAGSLNGGSGGANTLSFANFSTAVTANLAAGTSNKVTGGLSNIQTVIGGSGNDDLTGSSSFSSTLQGGGGDDTYRVTFGGAAITTTITEVALGGTDTVEVTGTSGADTFTMTAATTLSDGQHAVVFGGQVEDVNLDGLGAVDTLVGFNQANTFNVTGADAGDLGVIDFTSIESLTGGNNNDTFTFSAAGTISGTVSGGSGGTDVLNLSTDVDVVTISATGAGSVVDGSTANVINSFTNIDTVNGGATGANTLVNGTGGNATFNVTGANSGDLATWIAYSQINNLTGGAQDDTFTFGVSGTLSGTLSGGIGGNDVLNLSTDVDVVTISAAGAGSVVDGSSANVINSFTNIDTVNGGATGANTLVNGTGGNATFNITGSNSGTVLSTGFSNFGSLVGGNNVADSFVFDDAVVWAGSLNGGSGGANTLSFANFSTAVTANLAAGTSNKVTGGLSNIQTVIGGSGNDDLTGSSSFSSTLQGGGGDDTYRVTFGGAAITTTITEVALGGTDTVEVSGTSGADAFTMTAATTLSDGQHAVVFGGQVEDVNLDGLGAVDTLVGFNQANTFNVTGADAGDLGVIDFTSIESLTGGNVSDAFVFTALGSLGGDLQGGSGVDTYDFGGGGQVTGNINDTAGLSELYGTLAAGSITFGAVNLNSNTVLDTSSAGGSIGLGALTGSGYSLRISSGSGLKNLLGSVSGLSSSTGAALVLEGSGATDFASTVATNSGGIDASGSGGVTFHNGVTLGDGSVGTSFAGLVRFALSAATTFLGRDGLAFSGGVEVTGADLTINSQGSNVDLYGLDAGGRSVTIQAGAGTLDFLGQDAIQLQAFTVSAALTKLNSVTTTGTQSYTGPVRVSGTLDANRLEFYGSGAVTAANGTSAATTSAGQIHLDKSGGGPVVLANDGATTLTTGSTTSSLTLTVDNGDLTLGSGVQASTLIDLTVTAGGLFQTSGVLKAPTVSLTVSGATGTALAPIDTDTATQLDLDLGGNAFLVEQTLLDLGTAITYSGGVAVQTIDLTLSGGTARLAGNFGSVGDHFTLRVPTGSLQQVSGTFSADRLTVIASGGIGSTLSSLQTQAGSLDFTSGGSAGIYVSESNAVSFRADAGSGEVKVVTGGTLTIDGDITTTGDVVLRANSGNIQGSGVGSQTLSADDLQLLAPSGSILFNNLNLDINSGGTSSGGGIDLGDIVVTGDFTTTASGSVTQNGALEVGGVFTLNAANQSVVLNNAGNRFGSVAVRSDSLVLREADGMQLNQLEVNGSSSLISGGSITQTGALRTASLSLSASQGIVLENLLNRINVLGNVIRGAAFRLYNTVDLEINGEMSGGIAASGVQIVSEGDITLLSGTHILASGLGNDIVLASKSGNVADLSGASDSLETLSGSRFVIYSGTQVQTKTGLLTVNFIQLSSPYPSSPSGAGNAVLVREGLPGDTTIVVVVPYTPPVSPGAINVGDFGLRSIDIGNGGLGIGFRTGAGGSGGFGLFAVNDKGEAQEIGEDAAEALRELRRTLQEDMSASAKDDILQALADILSGRLDPREVRLPPGLLYQEDANGNSVIIKPELANQFLLSILDPKSYQQLAQALAALSKQP